MVADRVAMARDFPAQGCPAGYGPEPYMPPCEVDGAVGDLRGGGGKGEEEQRLLDGGGLER